MGPPYDPTARRGAWDARVARGARRRGRVFPRPDGYAPGGVTYANPYDPTAGRGAWDARIAAGVRAASGAANGGAAAVTQPDDQALREQLIQGDPTYIRTAAQARDKVDAASRNRANLIKQAIVKFGYVPPQWQSGYGDIDQATLTAAGENPFSTQRTLETNLANSRIDLRSLLGARGMYSSGALTGGMNQIGFANDQAQNEATQNLLGSLHGYEGDYANTVEDWGWKTEEAAAAAAANAAKLYPGHDWRSGQPAGTAAATSGYSPGVSPGALAGLYGPPKNINVAGTPGLPPPLPDPTKNFYGRRG